MTGFKIGELILSNKPYVYVLDNEFRGMRCDNCLKKNEDLKKCSKCKFVYFCDKTCQENCWELHKLECKYVRGSKHQCLKTSEFLRIMMLLLLKTKKLGEENPCEEVYGRKVTFKSLKSHVEELKQIPYLVEEYQEMFQILRSYLPVDFRVKFSEFLEMCGKMNINSIGLECENENGTIGRGLYLSASVFNHSCDPDIVLTFDGATMNLRAMKEIPHKDINRIHINYIDQMALTEDRQKQLKERYFFTCECIRCTSPEYDNHLTSTLIDVDEAKLKKYEKGIKKMQALDHDPEAKYNACLEELAAQEGVLGDTHIFRVKAFEIAVEACIQVEKYDEAEKFGKKVLEAYKLYCGPYSFKLGQLYALLGMVCSPIYYDEAEKIYQVTHGDSKFFYKES